MKAKIKHLRGYETLNKIGDIVPYRKYKGCSQLELDTTYGKHWLSFSSGFEIVEDEEEPKDEHYNNEKGSLYLFAQQHELNAWEFDIIKRIVRCRKKGQFKSDLEKTKRVIDLYLSEYTNTDDLSND